MRLIIALLIIAVPFAAAAKSGMPASSPPICTDCETFNDGNGAVHTGPRIHLLPKIDPSKLKMPLNRITHGPL